MPGGSSEDIELQEKLRNIDIAYGRLNDEWTGKLAKLEDRFQREKDALLQDFSGRLQTAKYDVEAKNAEIMAELEMFRRAFAGDSLGWTEAEDDQGKPYYFNSDTGESDYTKPRVLEISEVVRNADAFEEGKKKQEKAIKKGKELELHARKLEVSLNEIRAKVVALLKTKKEWEACGSSITSMCAKMSMVMDETDVRVQKIEKRVPVVKRALNGVATARAKMEQLTKQLQARNAKIEQLRQSLASAKNELESALGKAERLEARFNQAIEERVDEVRLPLENELAEAYAGHQEEKALRESDRRYIADLWPEGWLMPSLLRRFRTMSAGERAQRTHRMEEIEAERDLVEGIRAGVAAAAKWEIKTDDYGRPYYANWETGQASYEPPPEVGYRPPLGRSTLGEKVDPRLQLLREWQQGTDGWGNPFWQNVRTGEVIQAEPQGWSEAMRLEEHELEDWVGPSPGEVAHDVAVEAARVVVTWLNRARETEERRRVAEEQPLVPGDDASDAGDADDSREENDRDEVVYDIQSVEELAMGDDGWQYEGMDGRPKRGEVDKSIGGQQHDGGEQAVGVPELRSIIAKLARREDRYECRLRQVRHNLEDLAHDLLAAKRLEELGIHGCAIGRNKEPEKAKEIVEAVEATTTVSTVNEQSIGSKQSEEGQTVDPAIQPSAKNSDIPAASSQEDVLTDEDPTDVQQQAPEQHADGTASSPSFSHYVAAAQKSKTSCKGTDEKRQRNLRGLPDSLVDAIGERAFPLASEGIAYEAFHALAAEAIWAGLNGSERLQKPPESVWEARGGDRWGTAAFFAERLGEREEEAVPGLPRATILTTGNSKEDASDGPGGHPLSGSSARHATARAIRLASVSSRRGFLKQANDTAAREAREHLGKVAEKSTVATEIWGILENERADTGENKPVAFLGDPVNFDEAGTTLMGAESWKQRKDFKPASGAGSGIEDPVVRSAVMLEFEAEGPGHALGAYIRTVQFPIPDDWNDPEAREKQYTAQLVRRKETLEVLSARDKAALARPKGYEKNGSLTGSKGVTRLCGCQDARELLRYEAVVLEEMIHHALLDVNEKQEQLEGERAKAIERWQRLIKAEERALEVSCSEISRHESDLAKLSMDIRGLRVPLLEPQTPNPATLNPEKIKLPAPVPAAQAMRPDEVEEMVRKIRQSSADPLVQNDAPEHMAVEQGRKLRPGYEEAVSIYEYKRREWGRLEMERKERFSIQCHKSRLKHLSLDTLTRKKKSHEDHLDVLRKEASADENIAKQSQEAKQKFEATLAKQIAEENRAHNWLLRLQVELSDALVDRDMLERLPDAALNRLDMLRWEHRRAEKMIECRRRVAELREALVEEGRRRRQLYDEKRWAAQSELRRVLAESDAVEEKEGTLRLLLQVGEATLASRASVLDARQQEAEGDREGKGTDGAVNPGETYSVNRKWISEEYRKANADLKAWEEKLAELLHIRELARHRETTVGELVLGAARGALPPPHPDQWLPNAERERHEDEVRLLLERHERELRTEREAVGESREQVRDAVRDATILRARLEAIEGWRDHEILALRTASRDTVESLKGLLEKKKGEYTTRSDQLEQALSEIREEYNEVKAELTNRIEKLNRGRSNTEAWVKALRHDLATERAKRENTDERLATVTNNAKALSERLRKELRAERMHAWRLELWVAALRDEIRLQEKAFEKLKRQHEAERRRFEWQVRQERHHVWRQRTAVRLLCMSVDSLFLFFAQRLANLAGSRRFHNDALRANGAVKVLAAICRGPRKDLRRLAARALGALGWDGHIEARVLAWDIYRHWDLWVQLSCPAEEERLRRRERTFEDPEEFRHPDELSAPMSTHEDLRTMVEGSPEAAQLQRSEQKPALVGGPEVLASDEAQASAAVGDSHYDLLRSPGDAQSSKIDLVPVHNSHQRNDMLISNSDPRNSSGEEQTVPRNQAREQEEKGGTFRSTGALTARALVRERRQWALRRVRRYEGPNEANQLELGGGSPGVGEAWPDASGARVDLIGNCHGEGSVVGLLARLCQERDDWEVVRAAVAAISVVAYHEANANRMPKVAPELTTVLVDLLRHPDAEIHAHTATALANLARGSPAFQSEAGSAGAVEALLDVCRGRACSTGIGKCGTSSAARAEAEVSGGSKTEREKLTRAAPAIENSLNEEEEQDKGWKLRSKNRYNYNSTAELSADGVVQRTATPELESGGGNSQGGDKAGERREVENLDVDAIQASTAALANLLCYSEANSVRLVDAGGLGVLIGLLSSYRPHNLLDFDQIEEIQANVAEALVNATRNYGDAAADRVHSLGISPLVLLCGADNLQVKRHVALVLGNVCQSDVHRANAGKEGAVEGLFSLCDTNDDLACANALWALGNLAWNPYNQERIGRYTDQLVSLGSSSWLPTRTNALVCLGNALFFHETNRRRVEKIDGALTTLLRQCGEGNHPPVQEGALSCLVSLTYTDRIVAPLVEAGCIPTFIARLRPSAPTAVRHAASLALLNVAVHNRYKARVAEAGGLEAAVALLGSDSPEERKLAANILGALASADAIDDNGGSKSKDHVVGLSHLLGIVQMDGNLLAQKAAAEQIAQATSINVRKQQEMGDCGGVEALLGMCGSTREVEPTLLVPVVWSLRSCLHDNLANKDRFIRANGLETLSQLCHSSRSAGNWVLTESVLVTLMTASLGSEKNCRRLLRVGLDQIIDAAEDSGILPSAESAIHAAALPSIEGSSMKLEKLQPEIIPGLSADNTRPTSPREPASVDRLLGRDRIDEIGVKGVLRQRAEATERKLERNSREMCSEIATSLLQALGPFNYVVCQHCGGREKGGTTCSRCGYAIVFDFDSQEDSFTVLPRKRNIRSAEGTRCPVTR